MRHFRSIPLSFLFVSLVWLVPLCLQAEQPAGSQPIVPLKNASMAPDVHITWYGQACFGFHSREGNSLLTDPYHPDMVGYSVPDMRAKVVTVSHDHPDHNAVELVPGNPIVVRTAGETAVGGLVLHGTPSWHDNAGGKERGANLIFTWTMDQIHFAHLGDLGQHKLTPDQRKAIGPVDVLLIPVGGVYTITGAEAIGIVRELQPRMVIPMHFKTDILKIPLQPADSFLAGPYPIVKTGQSDLLLNRNSLPSKTTIFLMDYVHAPGGKS